MPKPQRGIGVRVVNSTDGTFADNTQYGGETMIDFEGTNVGMRVDDARAYGTKHVVTARGKLHDSSFDNVTHRTTVGQNDPCPCGSGKKFKHCHRR